MQDVYRVLWGSYLDRLRQYHFDGSHCVFPDGSRYLPHEIIKLSFGRESDEDLDFICTMRDILDGEILVDENEIFYFDEEDCFLDMMRKKYFPDFKDSL